MVVQVARHETFLYNKVLANVKLIMGVGGVISILSLHVHVHLSLI